MNREIKFRAWHNNKMYEVAKIDLWGSPDQATCDLAPLDFSEDELFDVYLQDVVLMQFTGLYDMNGKEIYEGDIIRYLDNEKDEEYLCLVEFDKNDLQYKLKNKKTVRGGIGDLISIMGRNAFEDNKIIGNIYENPELMEEEE